MQITPMTLTDYDAVHALWSRTPGVGLNEVDDSREGIEKYLRRNPNTCFVAWEKDAVIGVILSGHDGRRGYIYHMAVDVARRGRGVGGALADAALAALGAEGIRKAALVVFADNEIGNRFWTGRGFDARDDLVYRNRMIV